MIDMKKVYESVSDKEDELLKLEDYLDISEKLIDDHKKAHRVDFWSGLVLVFGDN